MVSRPDQVFDNFARTPPRKGGIFWSFFSAVFLLLIFYLPFQVALNIGPDIGLASGRILILTLFLFWLPAVLSAKKNTFFFSPCGFGLVAFLVISGLSLFVAQEATWGIRKFIFLFSIFPLYFMAASAASSPSGFKKTIRILFLLLALVSLVGLLQFLAQFFLNQAWLIDFYSKKLGPVFWGQAFSSLVSEYPSWFFSASGRPLMRAFGLFPDPHMMSFFLGLILPIAFALALFLKKGQKRLLALCFLAFAALLLTFSRGGYFGIIAAGLVVLLLAQRFLVAKKRRIVLAGLILALFILVFFARPALVRLASSFSVSEGSSAGRLAIWQGSFKIFLAHPVLGVGLGNYPKEVNPQALYRSPITSHNLYLDIASETGIFGLAIWLFLIFGSLYQLQKTIKKIKTVKSNEFRLAVCIGLAGSLIYFAVHSFFETAIFNPVVSSFLMIIFALTTIAANYEHNN